MKKAIYIVLSIILLAAIAAAVILLIRPSQKTDGVSVHDALVKDVKSMVMLCSMDIYEEMPVKASVGSRHLFARITLKGSISFDLDSLKIDCSGDTLRVQLPPERVEILESTDKDSYVVIYTWNDHLLGSDRLSTAEENKIKEKVKQNAVKNAYRKGYVRRARAEAVSNLTRMLSTITAKPVSVTDPTPAGAMQP